MGGVRLTARLPAGTRDFSQQAGLLLATLLVVNGANYIFHVVCSRLLGPSDYGALAALLAVFLVLSVPFGVLQTVLAKRTSVLRESGDEAEVGELSHGALKALVPIAVLAGLAVLVFGTPLLAFGLHVDVASAALLAPYVGLSILASVALGVLQGELRFRALAGLLVASVALRLAVGVGLVWAGFGVLGAVLGSALAPLAIVIPGFRLLGISRASWRAARRTVQHIRGDFATTLAALTSFWLLAEIDIAFARHFLSEHESGLYSSAGLLARVLLFLPGAVVVVAFPRFVAARERREGHMRWLKLSLAATAALVAVPLATLILLRRPLVSLAFGDEFESAARLVPLLAIAMTLLGFVGVLVYFHIAMGSRVHVLLLLGVGLETVLVLLFHETPEQIAAIVAVVAALVALSCLQAAVSVSRYRPPFEQAEPLRTPVALHANPTLQLSVVLPCHNAGAELRGVLTAVVRELAEIGPHEIIVVSDGSTDDTVTVGEEFASQCVRVIHYDRREGKGTALRAGLHEAHGRYVAFLDADGDIRPAIKPFLALMELYDPDIVVGSKRHPLSEVYYPPLRRILSSVYHKLARILFRVNVRDTQTGFKLIRRDVLAAVLPRLLEKRYAFDLEFLVVARSLGYKRVFEAPVQIDYQFASHVNPRAAFRIGLDTLAIFYRHHILNTYRQAGRHIEPEPFTPGAPVPGLTDGVPVTAVSRLTARRSESLRVLFLNWRDTRNPDAGGAEVFTHEVARRWAEAGNEVSLLTSKFDGAPATESIDGVRVRRVGRLRNGTFHLRVQRELARIRGVDVIIDEINSIPFLTPLWRHRLPPVVALIHQLAEDVWDAELPWPLAALGRAVEPRLLRLYADTPVVTVSESTRQDLLRLGIVNVSVVPNGRDEPPHLDGLKKEPVPTFLFVGRLTANKRPNHAVQAFRLISELRPDARLWIIGRGPLEQELRKDLPEGAELLGHVSRHELYKRMARAHVLLVPSVREGWGLVVIEANSVGTPAVGYDVPGVRDSICPDTGVLATADSAESLAGRALQLVDDAARYAGVCGAAEEWAMRFSWGVTAAAVFDVVHRTAKRADSPVTESTASTVLDNA